MNRELNPITSIYAIVSVIITFFVIRIVNADINILKEFFITLLNGFGGIAGFTTLSGDGLQLLFFGVNAMIFFFLQLGMIRFLECHSAIDSICTTLGNIFIQITINLIISANRLHTSTMLIYGIVAMIALISFTTIMTRESLLNDTFIIWGPVLSLFIELIVLLLVVLFMTLLPNFLQFPWFIIGCIFTMGIVYPRICEMISSHLVNNHPKLTSGCFLWALAIIIGAFLLGDNSHTTPTYNTNISDNNVIINNNEKDRIDGPNDIINNIADEINDTGDTVVHGIGELLEYAEDINSNGGVLLEEDEPVDSIIDEDKPKNFIIQIFDKIQSFVEKQIELDEEAAEEARKKDQQAE